MTDYHVRVVCALSRRRRSYLVQNAESQEEARGIALSDPDLEGVKVDEAHVCNASEVYLTGYEQVVDADSFRDES